MNAHNDRALADYPGVPPMDEPCPCHCHHPVGSLVWRNIGADTWIQVECDCDCCQGVHVPDLCVFPPESEPPYHRDRGGVCPCTQTEEEARAQYEAEMRLEADARRYWEAEARRDEQ